ncbi:hypothetical protein SAMD00023353_1601840 [Rosellinia necatrix]|uniref:Uncharacterized protein n=1 Tax=Rosellinia necatrix TaxID=77044 RepID=A0A1W2TI43_ROSNE|nr:hypothetical protein SAMD00023353_1601840 [Rosellinia necatrix]
MDPPQPAWPQSDKQTDSLLAKFRNGTDSIRYVSGHRAVYLATGSPEHDANMRTLLGGTAVMLTVDFSAVAPPLIEIFAEELIFVAGTKFDWKGKSVRIRCRRISLVSLSNTSALAAAPGMATIANGFTGEVVFDLSGDKGGPPGPKQPTPPQDLLVTKAKEAKAPGLMVDKRHQSFPSIDFYNARYPEGQPTGSAAQPGANGERGVPGKRGTDGGSFYFRAEEIDASIPNAATVFRIISQGGAGGAGQDGQDGSTGGNGLDWNYDGKDLVDYMSEHVYRRTLQHELSDESCDVWNNVWMTFMGGDGGIGGYGGPGGRGGSGGSVDISPKCLEAISQVENDPGPPGKDGQNGANGDPGKHSESRLFKRWNKHGNRNWEKFARRFPEGSEQRRICPLIHQWEKNNIHPIHAKAEPLRPVPSEELWRLFDPKMQQPVGTKSAPAFHDEPVEQLHRAYSANVSFLRRVLQRIEFENFIWRTSQVFYDNSPAATKSMERLASSLTWMSKVVSQLDTASVGVQSVREYHAKVLQAFESRSDVFGHVCRFVPFNPSRKEFEAALASFGKIEAIYEQSVRALEERQAARQTMIDSIAEAQSKIASSTKDIEVYQDVHVLKENFNSAVHEVNEARTRLYNMKGNLEREIRAHTNCSFEAVLDAISTSLMFTNFESEVAIGGAALSIGTGIAKSAHDALAKIDGVDKSLLYARLDTVFKDGDELKDEISKKLESTKAEREADKDYLAQIMMSRSKFDTMCDTYLARMKSTDEVKHSFTNLVKAVDRKNKVLADYNAAALGIAQAQLVISEQATLTSVLQSGVAGLSDDETQLADAFLSQAYQEMGRLTLERLWERVRGFNCIAFRRSRAFDVLAGMDSFSALDTRMLTVAIDEALNHDFIRLEATYASASAVKDTVVLDLLEADHPFKFQQLREDGAAEFEIDWATFQPCIGDKRAWDIRLDELQIYLVGASGRAAPGSSKAYIGLEVHNNGTFRFRNAEGTMLTFELPPSHLKFKHREIKLVDGQKPDDSVFVPVGDQVRGERFVVELPNKGHDPVSLQSPLGWWTIKEISGSDWEDCKWIRFQFKVTYRTGGG